MKFRSLLYIVIALASLGLSIILANPYGGYGCAFATSLALICGQVIIMNIYYQRKQHLDILSFWRDILKMSIAPIILVSVGLFVTNSSLFHTVSIIKVTSFGFIFTIVYCITFWYFSMDITEKELLILPLKKIKNKINMIYK